MGSVDAGLDEPSEDDGEPVTPGGTASDAGFVFAADREVVRGQTTLIRDDLLYQLSYRDGLIISDMSDPAAVRLLGHYPHGRLSGIQMYVVGDVVIVLYHDYEPGSSNGRVRRTVVRMVDVAAPARVEPLFELELPGEILSSRLVGDVLYMMANDRSCEECRGITVHSATVSDRRLQWADQLGLPETESAYGETLYATNERLFVASSSETYDDDDVFTPTSTIHVIDITDARGSLTLRPGIEVESSVEERAFLLDEHEGVLRVVSATDVHAAESTVFVRTFDSEGAQLGYLEVPLPDSVLRVLTAIDGPRAFVAAPHDETTLVALDLSDAAAPLATATATLSREAMTLELSPQRLIVLSGTERYLDESGVELSLFDVTTLGTLDELDRVVISKGSDGSTTPSGVETLRVDEGTELLAVGVLSRTQCISETSHSVELIEVRPDELVVRGSAPANVPVDAASFHRGHLILSGTHVLSYDLADPDAPEARSDTGIVGRVEAIALGGSKLARMGSSFWLDVVALDEATSTVLRPAFDLQAAVRQEEACAGLRFPSLYADAERAYLRYARMSVGPQGLYDYQTHEIALFDTSGDGSPQLLGTAKGPSSIGLSPTSPMFAGAPATLLHGGVLAFEQQRLGGLTEELQVAILGSQLEVVDLRVPSAPEWTTLELEGREGSTGLYARGELIYRAYFEPTDDPQTVRFYVRRVDIEDPADPKLLPPINVPGALVGVLDDSHIVTLDQQDEAFFVRRVRISDGVAIASSYDVPDELLPEDFVIDGQRLWMIASSEPLADRKRDTLVLIDGFGSEAPRGREVDTGAGGEMLRELRMTEHGLLVVGVRRAWRVEADADGEDVTELGEHACMGRAEVAGDEALCTTSRAVQSIQLVP